MITVTVKVIDDLRSKKIGDKIFQDRLEIIDKTEDLIVCSDLSYHNEPICYDFKGNCLSDFGEDNIGIYSSRYVMSESYIEKSLIKDLNDFCLGKLRKLRIIQNGIVSVYVISDDLKFSVSRTYVTPYLKIETSGDLHRCSLIDGMSLEIEISDLTRVEKLKYKKEQYVNNR